MKGSVFLYFKLHTEGTVYCFDRREEKNVFLIRLVVAALVLLLSKHVPSLSDVFK